MSRLFVAVVAVLLLSGCCTLMGGRTQQLVLRGPKDDPKLATADGATVLVQGRPVPVESHYAQAADDKGFGTMDEYANTDRSVMGIGVSRIALPRRTLDEHVVVQVYKPGYKTQRFALTSHLSVLYWLNILNIIGFPIDAFTGAMWTYTPETLELKFVEAP